MRRILPWLTAGALTTVLLGVLSVVARQLERQGANDAGLRLASEVGGDLAAGFALSWWWPGIK